MSFYTPTLNTVIIAAGLSLAACSSSPKKVEEPDLGAARVESAPAPTPIVNTPRGPSLTLDDVLFDFERATLRPDATTTVAQAAEYLKDNPERIAWVEGHTDSIGTEDYNQTLSMQRSHALKDALVEQGISNDRIKTLGLGETQPTSTNDTADGRQANRRVEIIFKKASEVQ